VSSAGTKSDRIAKMAPQTRYVKTDQKCEPARFLRHGFPTALQAPRTRSKKIGDDGSMRRGLCEQ
jgi:hypothetical protein